MRSVATQASFRLDCRMLIDEGPTILHVALGAERILVGCGSDVVIAEGAVNVVAVAALHQALIHPVMEGHVERRLHIGVALEAKLRLRGLQQLRLRVSVMHAMAAGATDAGPGMRRALEVGMRARVAAQAGRIQVLRRKLAQLNDLGNVPAALYVGLARPVTALAGRARAMVP